MSLEYGRRDTPKETAAAEQPLNHGETIEAQGHAFPATEYRRDLTLKSVRPKVWLKLLKKPGAHEQIFALLNGEGRTTSATEILAERLQEDADSIVFRLLRWDRGEKSGENIILTTPRFRIDAFLDRYDMRCLAVKRVRPWTPRQWRKDSQQGVRVSVSWLAEPPDIEPGPFQLLDVLQIVREEFYSQVPASAFWDLWGKVLDLEKEIFNEIRRKSGWKYWERRYGLADGIDFRVKSADDDILRETRGRIQIPRTGMRSLILEVREEQPLPGWVTAVPVHGDLDLRDIPEKGTIAPDSAGLWALWRREREALERLRRGQTVLASLNTLLPTGPQTAREGVPFKPLLRTDYTAEQQRAIEKALVNENMCCILGPPGTGKTTVIAELVAQVTDRGGRVLISSQSNLAVDNALEMVADHEGIFAVRIGNPLSVKLRKDLMLEGAAERYRVQTLARSGNALREEEEWIDAHSESLPSADELDEAIAALEAIDRTNQKVAELKLEFADAESQESAQLEAVRSGKRKWDEDLKDLNLNEEEANKLLYLVGILKRGGPDPDVLASKADMLVWLLEKRTQIRALEDVEKKLQSYKRQLEGKKNNIRIIERKIAKSDRLTRKINNKRAKNTKLEERRRRAKGIWQTIKVNVLEWKEDISLLEQELKKIDTTGAKRDLPRMKEEEKTLRSDLFSFETQKGVIEVEVRAPDGTKWDEDRTTWLHYLIAAERIEKIAGDIRYCHMLSSAVGLEGTKDSHERAKSAYQEAKKKRETLQLRLSETEKELAELEAQDWRSKLSEWAVGLNLFLGTLEDLPSFRAKVEELRARVERFQKINGALSKYHERLGIPGIDLAEAVFAEANVVAATCSGIASAERFDQDFDFVLVDEAARATPLELLIPLVRGKTIVLVGDHRQLPPIYGEEFWERFRGSQIAESPFFSKTLFEHLYDNIHPSRRQELSSQYRMVPAICEVVRKLSYPEIDLRAEGEALERFHPFGKRFPRPIHVVQCAGPKGKIEATTESGRHGLVNHGEVQTIDFLVAEMARLLEEDPPENPFKLGVIATYRRQAYAITKLLPKWTKWSEYIDIEIGTVDAFQGREKDGVIVSLVVTNPKERRFIYDLRRLNVALSRAKALLVVVGAVDSLGTQRRPPGAPDKTNPLWQLKQLLAESAGNEVFRVA